MDLKFETAITVRKPVKTVFDAVASGPTMSRFFPDASSGDLGHGATVRWTFRDGESVEVRVTRFVARERIEIAWKANRVAYETNAVIQCDEVSKGTRVTITESGWREDQTGLTSSYEHCSRWMHMLVCLKSYLECGIDLRS